MVPVGPLLKEPNSSGTACLKNWPEEASFENVPDRTEDRPSRLPDARDRVWTNYNTSGSAALTMVPAAGPDDATKKTLPENTMMFIDGFLRGSVSGTEFLE